MAVLIVGPAVATAAQRYAAPNGSLVSGCSKEEPCEIHLAFSTAGSNDEVIITAGDYGSASARSPE